MATSSAIIELPSSSDTSDQTPFTKYVLSRVSNEEQHLFVISFAEQVKRDPDAKIIDFDTIFRWLGYDRKDSALRLLKREFAESDYDVHTISVL